MALLWPRAARAQADEPGAAAKLEEPAVGRLERVSLRPTAERGPAFRVELAFGWATLVVDPDVGQGMGGGLFAAWGLDRRVGVELSGFFASNPYTGALGAFNYSFLAGNITAGPIFQLTRPGSRFMVTVDLALGAYVIVPVVLQSSIWTLGVSGGITIGYRLARWFGIGLKWRYHLFNLATISGPDFYDVKSLQKVGVVDRMEFPVYVAFYF